MDGKVNSEKIASGDHIDADEADWEEDHEIILILSFGYLF